MHLVYPVDTLKTYFAHGSSRRVIKTCSILLTFAHRVRMLGARTGEDAKDPGPNEF